MEERSSRTTGANSDLDPDLSIPYRVLRQALPGVSEDKWLELKDIALDNRMRQLADFIEQLRRANQLEPNRPVTIGGLVTTLEFLMNIFKTQRAIIEELKEAAIKTLGAAGGAARQWLGASFSKREGGRLTVRDIIAGTAAERADLKRGDVLIAIGACSIVEPADLSKAFVSAIPGDEIGIKILRDGHETSVSVVSEAVVFGNADIKGPNVNGKRCDACCDCTIPRPNTGCQTVWKFRGNGPNGGLLYEKQCGALDLTTLQIVSNFSCGTGEYF
jgi:hypothetical protein